MAKKIKNYTEAELLKMFSLSRHIKTQTALMQDWLAIEIPVFNAVEEDIFNQIYEDTVESIQGWNEEDLKMKLISYLLLLGHLIKGDKFVTFFEKTIEASVQGYFLKTKTNFMVASGILNLPEKPYFHFQEYKPQINPTGEPIAQLLAAMLIAQEMNQNNKPIYGCEIIGATWRFVILEGKTYCISQTYDCTKKEDLLSIIAILRKFRTILETNLLT